MALDRHMLAAREKALEGGLEPKELADLERHLAECPPCAEDFVLAGRTRTWLSGTLPEEFAPGEADRLAARVERAIGWRPAPLRLKPAAAVSLVGAGLFALVLLTLNFDRGALLAERPRGFSVSALAAPGSGARAALEREELPGLEPVSLGNFSSPAGMSRVALFGFGQPAFRQSPVFGRRVLRLGGGDSGEGELTVKVGTGTPAPARASLWIFPEDDSVLASLEVSTLLGRRMKVPPVYRAGKGEWSWLVFELEPAEILAGGGLRELHFRVSGTAAVMLAAPEIWCKGGGR